MKSDLNDFSLRTGKKTAYDVYDVTDESARTRASDARLLLKRGTHTQRDLATGNVTGQTREMSIGRTFLRLLITAWLLGLFQGYVNKGVGCSGRGYMGGRM